MSTATELERLQAIEARLLARWQELEARRLVALPLVVRLSEDGEQREVETMLGYRPRVSVEYWDSHKVS